ncbi:MAG: DegT/DnrJ/EryC1/StrS family aminotransferase [Rhodoferax sp.]|uniref:DegT/DnrJ/EryC1/StrS family aminotransferase n=1 Tax=Rhodoferax sp. TaxID=50421 RepID=UPI002637C977|nr:DegT/DnrJ/EryC1/StrS family aminotransferase [Rhodoferax sp.]MDD2882869.1 DegT/DnrJ/EryC1/StrS family aminotransferase [Rhodoferax sp.]
MATTVSTVVYTVFHYIPLHSSPRGQVVGRAAGSMANTDSISDRLVRLPMWLGLEEHLAEVIAEVVAAV